MSRLQKKIEPDTNPQNSPFLSDKRKKMMLRLDEIKSKN